MRLNQCSSQLIYFACLVFCKLSWWALTLSFLPTLGDRRDGFLPYHRLLPWALAVSWQQLLLPWVDPRLLGFIIILVLQSSSHFCLMLNSYLQMWSLVLELFKTYWFVRCWYCLLNIVFQRYNSPKFDIRALGWLYFDLLLYALHALNNDLKIPQYKDFKCSVSRCK